MEVKEVGDVKHLYDVSWSVPRWRAVFLMSNIPLLPATSCGEVSLWCDTNMRALSFTSFCVYVWESYFKA